MNAPTDTIHALRVAAAVTLCAVVVEWWQLTHANLAVWTTFMVMAQWTYTIFQKGVERILGRGLGIVLGYVLVTLLPDAWAVRFLIEVCLLLTIFYLYFANWLAYTFLNAGLYLIALVELGLHDPASARSQGEAMFLAVVVGVVVAELVLWLTGPERDFHIQAVGQPLWPLRFDWIQHAAMLVCSAFVALLLRRGSHGRLASTKALPGLQEAAFGGGIGPEDRFLLAKDRFGQAQVGEFAFVVGLGRRSGGAELLHLMLNLDQACLQQGDAVLEWPRIEGKE
jgi:hypothetical protein